MTHQRNADVTDLLACVERIDALRRSPEIDDYLGRIDALTLFIATHAPGRIAQLVARVREAAGDVAMREQCRVRYDGEMNGAVWRLRLALEEEALEGGRARGRPFAVAVRVSRLLA